MTSPASLLAALRFYRDAWDIQDSVSQPGHNIVRPSEALKSDRGHLARSAIAAFEAEQKEGIVGSAQPSPPSAEDEALINDLERIDRTGGLGYDAHDVIRKAHTRLAALSRQPDWPTLTPDLIERARIAFADVELRIPKASFSHCLGAALAAILPTHASRQPETLPDGRAV